MNMHVDVCMYVWILSSYELQVGLVYDNLIVGYGRFIGEGPLLKKLSQPRFFLHEVTLPLLVLVTNIIGLRNEIMHVGSGVSILLW